MTEIPEELSPLAWDPGDLERLKANWDIFCLAAKRIESEPQFLGAIGLRESRIQSILGDGGRGHGIMQLDTGSYKGLFLPGMPTWGWKEPILNIPWGALCWMEKFDYLGTYTDLDGPTLSWFATAAYNCGQGTMVKVWEAHREELANLTIWDMRFWALCDSCTTGRDYALDVFRHYRGLRDQYPEGV
jgi:hypothetical protein